MHRSGFRSAAWEATPGEAFPSGTRGVELPLRTLVTRLSFESGDKAAQSVLLLRLHAQEFQTEFSST